MCVIFLDARSSHSEILRGRVVVKWHLDGSETWMVVKWYLDGSETWMVVKWYLDGSETWMVVKLGW